MNKNRPRPNTASGINRYNYWSAQKDFPFKRKRKSSEKILSQDNDRKTNIHVQEISQFNEFKCGENMDTPLGLFKIIDNIAIGRCCEVYIGEDQSTLIKRAVKVFIKQQNYKGALARELKFLDILTPHPHIVLPFGNFLYEDKDVLIHELLSKTVKEILVFHDNSRRLTSEWLIIKLAKHLFRALSHMHKNGIVHGDLKPQNVMWCGNKECFKLIDFGVSFRTSENIRHSIQSRAYQAPETILWNKWLQVNRKDSECSQPGPPADVWSAGCIVSELLCGGKVFQFGWNGENVEDSLMEALSKIKNKFPDNFLDRAKNWLSSAMNREWEERGSCPMLLHNPFLTEFNSQPSLLDLFLLPTTVMQLLKLIRPEFKDYKNEIINEILEKIHFYRPLDHLLDEETGSLFIHFSNAQNSIAALQSLKNTSVRGYTIVASFFPTNKWIVLKESSAKIN